LDARQAAWTDVVTLRSLFKVVIETLVYARMTTTDDGIVTTAAAGTFNVISDAAAVIGGAPGMSVTANRSALGNRLDHLCVAGEELDLLATAVCH
jgi:hypothetical protein